MLRGSRIDVTGPGTHFVVSVCQPLGYVMRAAPKVTPPVYFHGKYSRYKEHNNTI